MHGINDVKKKNHFVQQTFLKFYCVSLVHDNTEMQIKRLPERVHRPYYNRRFCFIGSQRHVAEFRGDKQIIADEKEIKLEHLYVRSDLFGCCGFLSFTWFHNKKKNYKKKQMQLSGGTGPLNKTVSILPNRSLFDNIDDSIRTHIHSDKTTGIY